MITQNHVYHIMIKQRRCGRFSLGEEKVGEAVTNIILIIVISKFHNAFLQYFKCEFHYVYIFIVLEIRQRA